MSKAKVVFNIEGFNQLRKSAGVEALVRQEAEAVCNRAKSMHNADGYIVEVKQMETRVIAGVITDDLHAIHSNLKHNTLLKALQG